MSGRVGFIRKIVRIVRSSAVGDGPDNQRLEALQAAVERPEGGKTFDPKIDASDKVSRIFQVPAEQNFAHGEDPADETRRSH